MTEVVIYAKNRRSGLGRAEKLRVHNPPQQNRRDRNCRRHNQKCSHQTRILRAQVHRLRKNRRSLSLRTAWNHSPGKRRSFAKRVKTIRKAGSGKPCVGPQDGKPAGSAYIETPAIHGTKNLHDFLLIPRAWLSSQPPRSRAPKAIRIALVEIRAPRATSREACQAHFSSHAPKLLTPNERFPALFCRELCP